MRRPVRDEEDATGTHIGAHPTGGAQVFLVLTVADIVLKIVLRAHIMIVSIIKEKSTARENAYGLRKVFALPVFVSLNVTNVMGMVFYVLAADRCQRVIIAVTVITWVLLELKPIVVQILIAGEKIPIVCLEFLVQSVATHGHGILLLVLIVTDFLSTYAHTYIHTHTHTHT